MNYFSFRILKKNKIKVHLICIYLYIKIYLIYIYKYNFFQINFRNKYPQQKNINFYCEFLLNIIFSNVNNV